MKKNLSSVDFSSSVGRIRMMKTGISDSSSEVKITHRLQAHNFALVPSEGKYGYSKTCCFQCLWDFYIRANVTAGRRIHISVLLALSQSEFLIQSPPDITPSCDLQNLLVNQFDTFMEGARIYGVHLASLRFCKPNNILVAFMFEDNIVFKILNTKQTNKLKSNSNTVG